MRWSSISLCFPVVLSITGVYFAQTATPAPTPLAVSPSPERLAHLGDLIDVDVIGSFEYDWRGTLTPEGFLDGLDTLDEPIRALCRTENEIAADIVAGYAKTLRDPKVAVRILDTSNRAVAFLDGAVKFPQKFQIKRPVRLNEIVIRAGGITENASGEINIFRPRNLSCGASVEPRKEMIVNASQKAPSQTISVKISDLIRGIPEANPAILSGDIVTIVEASPIYIMGGVNAPRQISARTRTTLSRAIAMGGGVAKNGLDDAITVYRRKDGRTEIMQFNLRNIVAGSENDPVLVPYDIVEVGRKGFRKRQFPPVIDTGGFQSSRMINLPLRIID